MQEPRFEDHRLHAEHIVRAVLDAADPRAALRKTWKAEQFAGARIHVLGIGKASLEMVEEAAALIEATPGATLARGIATVLPERLAQSSWNDPSLTLFAADHPTPTPRNVAAAEAIERWVREIPPPDTLIALISGGGSAHLALPAEGLTVEMLAETSSRLMRAGADIRALNTVRKHCERLKGGRLGAMCQAQAVQVFVLSDVVGDSLDSIASGPFAPDPTTYAEALVIARAISAEAPRAVIRHLQRGRDGAFEETPKPGEPRLGSVIHTIVSSNITAIAAASTAAQALGFATVLSVCEREGEASTLGAHFAARCLTHRERAAKPAAIIGGGEPTVSVGGSTGIGGPSQEFALAAALAIAGQPRVAVMSFSTDGRDGPTDAAGAMVTGETVTGDAAGIRRAEESLANHDSHAFLGAERALIVTGPTGTNVNHVMVGLAYT